MAGSSGTNRRIRDALIELLGTVQYGGEPAFTEVTGTTKGAFDAYPAVRVLPGGIENEPSAYGEVERTVTLNAMVHLEVESNGESDDPQLDAIDKMYDLTDAIVDVLDKQDVEGGLDQLDPELETLQMTSSVVDWDFLSGPSGTELLFIVRIQVQYSKTVSDA